MLSRHGPTESQARAAEESLKVWEEQSACNAAPVSEGAPPDLIGDFYNAILGYIQECRYGSTGNADRAVGRVANAKAALQAHLVNLESDNARLTAAHQRELLSLGGEVEEHRLRCKAAEESLEGCVGRVAKLAARCLGLRLETARLSSDNDRLTQQVACVKALNRLRISDNERLAEERDELRLAVSRLDAQLATATRFVRLAFDEEMCADDTVAMGGFLATLGAR